MRSHDANAPVAMKVGDDSETLQRCTGRGVTREYERECQHEGDSRRGTPGITVTAVPPHASHCERIQPQRECHQQPCASPLRPAHHREDHCLLQPQRGVTERVGLRPETQYQ